MSLGIRCPELSFDSQAGGELAVTFLKNLPLLEYLELHDYTSSVAEQLLHAVETSSPLLWSLTMRVALDSCSYLEHFPSLLRRIRRFDINIPLSEQFTDGLVIGLQNLTELM
jgi:hypothetical protein